MPLYRKLEWLIPAFLIVLILPLSSTFVLAQGATPQSNPAADKSPVQSGYAVVTPTSAATSGLVVFETFGERHGNEMTQAGVLPSDMATQFMLFVSTNGRLSKNLGVAIANPGSAPATITLTLRDNLGATIATQQFAVPGRAQTARFVTDIFSSQPNVPKDLTGSLLIGSDIPVAVVGLRFRGVNFSALPATHLSALSPVPVISTGVGGSSAAILPQFAAGGGWATEIVLANSGPADLEVRVDLFNQSGQPLVATLNGTSSSSFLKIAIPKGGVVVLSPMESEDDGF